MSLPSSFTLRPRVKASPDQGKATRLVDDEKADADADTSEARSIQFTFSGQENEESANTCSGGAGVGGTKRTHPSSSSSPSSSSVHLESTQEEPQWKTLRAETSFPIYADRNLRRSIRVSPFQPMAHQRRMPRHGTISPLKVEEYQSEQKQQRSLFYPNGSGNNSMMPPMVEVRIPEDSTNNNSTNNSDYLLSSPQTPSTYSGFTDYKSLYFQSQQELKALQKLQERTLEENHLLRSRIRTLSLRRRAETNPGSDGTLPGRSFLPPQHARQPSASITTTTSSSSTTASPLFHRRGLAPNPPGYPFSGQGRAPTVRRESTVTNGTRGPWGAPPGPPRK